MKKVIAFLFLIFSINAQAQDFSSYCSTNSANKSITGALSSISGFNMLTRNVAESILQSEIEKETGAKFKVKINNFYANNFIGGEFRSLSAYSPNYAHDGIYLKDVKVETICDYNRVLFENDTLYFRENMVLNFSAKLDEQDLKRTLSSGKLNKKLVSIFSKVSNYDLFLPIINAALPISFPIKIDENNSGRLKISKIEIKNKAIYFNSYILILKNR